MDLNRLSSGRESWMLARRMASEGADSRLAPGGRGLNGAIQRGTLICARGALRV